MTLLDYLFFTVPVPAAIGLTYLSWRIEDYLDRRTQTRAAGVNATRPAHASTSQGGTEGRHAHGPESFRAAGVPAPAARTTSPIRTTDRRTS